MDKIERRFTSEPFQVRVAEGDSGQDHHHGPRRRLQCVDADRAGLVGLARTHCTRGAHGLTEQRGDLFDVQPPTLTISWAACRTGRCG